MNFKIEYLTPDKLKVNPSNPRLIKDTAFKSLVKSLEECPSLFDARPCICSDRTGDLVILAGNMRFLAAKELKYKKIPVIVMHGLTEAQEKEILIKDNGTTWGEWNFDLLANEFCDFPLKDWGVDLPEDWLKPPDPDASEDDFDSVAAAEAIKCPVTKLGEIWMLGKHRIMCGDSTKAEDVDKLLGGAAPMLMITDPPYGVEYDPEWRKEAGVNKNDSKMGKVQNDDRADWTDAWALSPSVVAYVWHADRHAKTVQESLEACDFIVRNQIIWVKDRFALSRGNYHWQHEPCWYAVRKNNKAHWIGDHSQTTSWQIPSRDDSGHGHSTQKPLECMARPIRNHEGDVYDPFLGSGTTLIACEQLGRICYGMEIDPVYCDVIRQRFEKAFPDIEIRRVD